MADSNFPHPPLSTLREQKIKLKVSVVGADSRYAEGNGDSWVSLHPHVIMTNLLTFLF